MNEKLSEFQAKRAEHPHRMLLLATPTGWIATAQDAKDIAGLCGEKVKKRKGGYVYEFPGDRLPDIINKILDTGHEVAVCETLEATPDAPVKLHVPPLRLASPPEDNPADDVPPTEEDYPPEPVDEEEETEAGEVIEEEAETPAVAVASAPAVPKAPQGFDFQGRLFVPRKLKVLASAAGETGRWAMGGIRLLRTVEGWQAQATDGRVLVWVEGENGTPHDYSLRSTFATILTHNTDTEQCVIPADAWEKGLRQGTKEDAYAGISLGRTQSAIAVGGGILRTPPVDGRFPDVGAIARDMGRKPPLVTIHFNPAFLEKLCRMMSALGAGHKVSATEWAPRITLLIYGGDKPMGIVGRTEDGLSLSAAIMPLA